jgi:DNA-binding transcriptional LysR family regulator
VRHDDALAGRRSISVRKLLDRPIVCLPRGTGVRTAFDDGCASRNLQPRVAFEASAPDVVAGLAIRGLGVAVLSESMVAVHARELRAVAITDPRMRSRLELIWRADAAATPAARALVAHARRAASS